MGQGFAIPRAWLRSELMSSAATSTGERVVRSAGHGSNTPPAVTPSAVAGTSRAARLRSSASGGVRVRVRAWVMARAKVSASGAVRVGIRVRVRVRVRVGASEAVRARVRVC